MNNERKQTYLRLCAEGAFALVLVGIALLFGPTLLQILLPFILALIMAWAFNPLISSLQKHLKLTRKLFSYVLVLLFYAVVFGLCTLFAVQVASQVVGLVKSIPSIVAQLQRFYSWLVQGLSEVLDHLPPEYAGVRQELMDIVSRAWTWIIGFLTNGLSSVMGMTSGVALEVPSFVIFLTVLVLASCIITADFPNLRESIYGYLGAQGKQSVRLMGHSFLTAVVGFFRSQLIFAIIDLFIIIGAFLLIGVPYPLPIALLLCVLDFIPFFGAGTVLVPWGLIVLVLGMTRMGAQLLLLYAVLYLLRRVFEPRILGGSTGFSSLQMLLSMYTGLKLFGMMGLVFAPILWISVVNFIRTGIFDGVMADIRYVVSDLQKTLARPVPTVTKDFSQLKSDAKPPKSEQKHSFFHKKNR